MKHYLFDPRLFDGPALFDITFRYGPDLAFVITVLPNGWRARVLSEGWGAETRGAAWGAALVANGWSTETQPSGWKAAVRRDEI